jgi:hypothetical protein
MDLKLLKSLLLTTWMMWARRTPLTLPATKIIEPGTLLRFVRGLLPCMYLPREGCVIQCNQGKLIWIMWPLQLLYIVSICRARVELSSVTKESSSGYLATPTPILISSNLDTLREVGILAASSSIFIKKRVF